MNCETCARRQDPVPFAVHELAMARQERTIRRLWILLLILILLLVGSNALWMHYEAQFEDIEITQENDRGINNFIGNDGDIHNYGEAEDQDQAP